MKEPNLKLLESESNVFHDSFLRRASFSDDLSCLEIILECSFYKHKFWKLSFNGLLRFEFESIGTGIRLNEPVDIYEVCVEKTSAQLSRWEQRMEQLEVKGKVYHIVLCSSYLRGLLDDNKDLEGIQVVCREIEISKAYL